MNAKTIFILLALHVCYVVSTELNLQDVEIPDMDDFSVIKEKCDRLGGNGTYETLKASKDSLQSCLQGFVDFTVLKNEVEEAKKTGSMDEVFGKYCNKRPKLASCVQNFTNALKHCLEEDEKKALNTTLDVLKQLGEFVCYRDGDRIAMFVAEGGVECIKDHTEGIKNCVNNTFQITASSVNPNSLPNLFIDKKKCDDFGKLQHCVVEELEKCHDSTPANIVDALFRFIKRSACTNKPKRSIHSIIRRSLVITNNIYNTTEVQTKVIDIIKEKCSQNSPDGGFEAFTASLEKAGECIKNAFRSNPMFNIPADQFKQNVKTCVQNITEKTKNCLSEEEKFWPQFQVDVLLNLIDVFYNHKDLIRRPTSRSEMINCFQNFRQPSVKQEVNDCMGTYDDYTFNEENVCKRIQKVKTCFSEQYKKRCIREITITKLFDEIFKALMAPPCNEIK